MMSLKHRIMINHNHKTFFVSDLFKMNGIFMPNFDADAVRFLVLKERDIKH